MSAPAGLYWVRLAKASMLVLAGIAVQLWIDGPQPGIQGDAASAGRAIATQTSRRVREAPDHSAVRHTKDPQIADDVVQQPRAIATAGQRTPSSTDRLLDRGPRRDLAQYRHEAPHAVSDVPAVVRTDGLPDLPDAEVPAVPLTRRLVFWSRDAAMPIAPTVPELAAVEPRRNAVVSDSAPAASVVAAAPVGRVAPRVAPAAARHEEDSILQVLREYEEAVGRKDPAAAKAVWPALDDRALARAFNGLQSHSLALEDCGVTVANTNAAARAKCQGIATYLPKIGRRKPISATHEWTFSLSKSGGDWQIESAAIR